MPEPRPAIDAHLDPAGEGLALDAIQDFARRDLIHAAQVALARDGALLSAGEGVVARALLACSEPAQSLYARLFGRKARVFWLDELAYAEVPDLPAAAAELLAAGLCWDALRLAPTRLVVEASTVAALTEAARALGRSTRGPRAALVERLQDADARALLVRPGLILRHRGLIRRLCRLYLHDHQGDLSRFVVARLGLLRPPDYAPTGGEGLFPRRVDLLDYEAALARSERSEAWTEEDLLREGAAALAAMEASPPPPEWRARFSARRWDERVAFSAGRLLERQGQMAEAEAVYGRILAAGARHGAEVALRRALCLERLERTEEAARLCEAAREGADPASALALARTGKRLSKRAKLPWTPLPEVQRPPERRVGLHREGHEGRRPGWRAGAGTSTVEAALVALLAQHGREAIFGENELWTSLFGLLFRDALFAPVQGMLPTPLLSAPLDLGLPGFYERRAPILDAILAEIAAGGGQDRMEREIVRSEGLAIAGVRWDLFEPATLARVAGAIPPEALAATLRLFAEDWRGAVGGLPDLCLLPGPAVDLPEASPAPLGPELRFVEVKGPTDALRDGQGVWHDRLLRAGVPVELWWVDELPAPPASDLPSPA